LLTKYINLLFISSLKRLPLLFFACQGKSCCGSAAYLLSALKINNIYTPSNIPAILTGRKPDDMHYFVF
jgi:hypothetical protein